jgi:hypothetical protein
MSQYSGPLVLNESFLTLALRSSMPRADGDYDSPMIIDADPHKFVGDGNG